MIPQSVAASGIILTAQISDAEFHVKDATMHSVGPNSDALK